MARKNRRRADPWVGAWLRSLREDTTLTRGDIAGILGRDESSVSRIETGITSISADDLPSVLVAYGVTPAQFAREASRRQVRSAA